MTLNVQMSEGFFFYECHTGHEQQYLNNEQNEQILSEPFRNKK